ncbi:unnamed protein product [Durusdinium trenchii]|uniref:Nicotinamide-nucleotide adenylyltransferase n=1 Tax=Durusdinium trenchii TaxID=1381693 RepID=A0ABP0PAY5_9DINO
MSICHEVDATPSWQLVLSALLLILLPEALAFGLFSSMGFAANIASFAADSQVDLLGNVAAVACALALAAAFIVDVHRRNLAVQALFAFLLAGGFLATSSLKYIGYPWLSSLVCFAFAIILVAGLRLRCFKGGDDGIPGQRFFDSVAVSFVLATLVAFACWVGWQAMFDRFWSLETRKWLASQNEEVYEYFYDNSSMALNYTAHCSEEKDVSFLDTDAQAAVLSACKSAETVWFLQWAGPCAIGIGNVIVALVSWVFAQAAQGLEYDEAEAQRVKSALKKSTALIVMMLTVMYSAQYVSGANVTISSGLVALGAASVASIVGFMLLEFGFQRLNSVTQKDRLAQNLMKILKSDWMKAVMVFGLNLFIPVMLLLDAVRQKVRKCTGLPTEDGKFTKEGQRIIDEMHTWAWSSIFFKVNLLGMMGVALLLGMKVTYVFFAWLNQTLAAANLTFIVLSLMVLGVGLAMFLCPIVPGSAVYLFAGVVLGAQSQVAGPDGVIGFGWGIVAGALVSSVAKMIACTLQYSMGYGMGKFVKVQQFVGVDKVPTRAMEQILKQRGMKMDKVSILVAGPDWPTSVLCGILRLNIPRMLLGTLPVIGVSIVPQVLVGALLTYSDESSSGVMSIVSSGVTLAAAVVQALAMFYFTYRIMKVVDEDGEKLAEPRQEHAAVAALTEKEKDYVAALLQKSQWGEMKRFQRVLVLLSSMCMLTSSFVFIADYSVADKFCFRSFEITGQIDLPIDQGGLAGDVMNLVIIPWGWCALGLALAGVIFHIVVNKWLACDARAHLMRDHPNEDRPQNGPRSSTAYEEALSRRSGRNLAVLVFPGAFSPVHMGHLVMMDQATERLQRAGYDVLAGWLAPLANCGHLSASFRLKALSELKSKLQVSEWAVRNEKTKEMEVVHALRETLLEETGTSSKASPRVRVVAVCGADEMKRYSSLKPQDMLGLVVVPQPGDEEFLLEKPLQQIYIAEASQSQFNMLDGKILEEAIAGGDMAFVNQALPPDVNRLALFPTLQEQQDFGFDLAKLETQVPDGPWPAAKLMKKLVSIAPEAQGAHTWALLILSDAMVPAMKYHLDLLAKAVLRGAAHHGNSTEVDLKDVQVDAAAVPNCGWCKVPSLHSGFATAMKDYLRRGGENQLQNYRSGDLCFKGTRLFNYDDAPTAAVPTLATVLVSRHPKVEAIASQKARRSQGLRPHGLVQRICRNEWDWWACLLYGSLNEVYSSTYSMTTYLSRVKK